MSFLCGIQLSSECEREGLLSLGDGRGHMHWDC